MPDAAHLERLAAALEVHWTDFYCRDDRGPGIARESAGVRERPSRLPRGVPVREPIGRSTSPSNIDRMDERSERIARRFELPMIITALLVIPVIVLEESPVGEPWDTITAVLNWAIWLAFLTELVVMLAVVPDRWHWLRKHPLELWSLC